MTNDHEDTLGNKNVAFRYTYIFNRQKINWIEMYRSRSAPENDRFENRVGSILTME